MFTNSGTNITQSLSQLGTNQIGSSLGTSLGTPLGTSLMGTS